VPCASLTNSFAVRADIECLTALDGKDFGLVTKAQQGQAEPFTMTPITKDKSTTA
jgi:hypothetical protein